MELVRPEKPLEFQYEDVTFLVKAKASAGDRMDVKTSGRWDKGGYHFSTPEFNRAIIRRMVLGWRGVTLDGKDVPYAFETMDNYFPITGDEDVYNALGVFIVEKTGILKQDNVQKNASRARPTGSSR